MFLLFASGVVNTGGKFAAVDIASGVIDTGGKFAAGVVDTSGKFATGINDNSGIGSKFATVVDAGGAP